MSILAWDNLRGVRSGAEFCASAVIPKATAIAEAMTPREILRVLRVL
jgi:hypothetical protein